MVTVEPDATFLADTEPIDTSGGAARAAVGTPATMPMTSASNAPAWVVRARRCVLTSTAFRSRGPRFLRCPVDPATCTPSATMPCHTSLARPRAVCRYPQLGSYRPDMSPAHNNSQPVAEALDALDRGVEPGRIVLRDAVRA